MIALLQISEKLQKFCRALAEKRLAQRDNKREHYRNDLHSHIVGVTGEAGAYVWAKSQGLDVVWHTNEATKPYDLTIEGKRIEIKSWTATHYGDLGRAIADGQIRKLQTWADAVIWVAVSAPGCATPMGWNYITDMAKGQRVNVNGYKSWQLAPFQVMPMESLADWLKASKCGKLSESGVVAANK